MDTPVRKYQKQKDYQRHKLFRKMKRRRKAAIEQAKDAPMKPLRRKFKIPKFEGGKDENKELPYPLRSSKDYDDNLAYQSGIIRDPKTGHMWSTTQEEYPHERTYLKKPNHPTFNKALWGDLISGYDVYFKNGNTYSAPTFSELMYIKPPFKFKIPKFEDGKDNKPNVFQLADGTFVNNHNEPLEVLDYAGVEDPTKWTYVDKKGNRYTPKATRTLTEGEQFTQRQIENEQNTRPFEFTPYIEGANEGAAAASLMMGFPFNMAGSAYYGARSLANAYFGDYLDAALDATGAIAPAGSGIYDRIKLAIENYRQPLKKLESPVIRTVQDNGKIRLSLPTHTDSNPRQFVLEPQGDNKFYVHMRTWDGDHVPANLSNEDKQTLFQALYDELPDGAEILFPKSGPGYYGTRGTVAGLQRLARDSRFTPGTKGTLQYLDKDGKTVKTYEGTSFIKTPRITAENAANITPEQWTAAQDAAIARGDMAEAQRLRDLHFKVSAPNTKTDVPLWTSSEEAFNSFDLSHFGETDSGFFGYGHYLTPIEKYAATYHPVNRKFYANIENPYIGSNDQYFNRIQYVKDRLARRKENVMHNLRDGKLTNFSKKLGINENTSLEDAERLVDKYIADETIKWNNRYVKYADEFEGKDGVLSWRELQGTPNKQEGIYREVVVPRGEQIKSADAVTYDDKGVRIPLGLRDNFNINDIRYGLLAPLTGGTALLGYNSLGQPIDTYKHGKDSGIHINPKNRGKFNALKKRTGKTTEQLTHSKNPLTRKRAIFAQNAKKWKH